MNHSLTALARDAPGGSLLPAAGPAVNTGIFAAFVLMAVVLVVRPWGLLGKPIER